MVRNSDYHICPFSLQKVRISVYSTVETGDEGDEEQVEIREEGFTQGSERGGRGTRHRRTSPALLVWF